MKKTINKIIFIFALVILVNIIPTEAKAATISYTFPPNGQTVLLTYTMITHYGESDQGLGSIATQSSRILLDVSATYTYPQISSVFYATLIEADGTAYATPSIPNDFPFSTNSTGYGNNSYDHDPYYSVGGFGSIRFTVPPRSGSFYIRVYVTSGTAGVYHDIPFTVSSAPTFETHVYWCTNASDVATCTNEIPQDGNKITTSAITPGTPIRFRYKAIDLNQGFTCTMPNGSPVSPALNIFYYYPPSGTTTIDAETSYNFHCNNPKVLAVSTWLSSVSGTQATLNTLVIPVKPWAGTISNTTEVGFLYYGAGSVSNSGDDAYLIYSHGGSSSGITAKIVCSNPTSDCMSFYSTTISGLSSSSSYDVQSYAKNARGVTLGNTRRFTTQ